MEKDDRKDRRRNTLSLRLENTENGSTSATTNTRTPKPPACHKTPSSPVAKQFKAVSLLDFKDKASQFMFFDKKRKLHGAEIQYSSSGCGEHGCRSTDHSRENCPTKKKINEMTASFMKKSHTHLNIQFANEMALSEMKKSKSHFNIRFDEHVI
jgi:hypothetical protein